MPYVASMEIWKIIPSAPEYAASSLGRIRRVIPDQNRRKPRVLAQAINSTGRAQVSICSGGSIKSKKVHRLVCEAFHGPPPAGKAITCHKDGNPLNNRPENIYWGNYSDNGMDASIHGTIARGARNGNSKLTENQARAIKSDTRSSTIISRETGVHFSTVCRIRSGNAWKHL